MKYPRTAGSGYTKKFGSSSGASSPIFFLELCKYLEGFLNRGWTLFSGSDVVYEPQLF